MPRPKRKPVSDVQRLRELREFRKRFKQAIGELRATFDRFAREAGFEARSNDAPRTHERAAPSVPKPPQKYAAELRAYEKEEELRRRDPMRAYDASFHTVSRTAGKRDAQVRMANGLALLGEAICAFEGR